MTKGIKGNVGKLTIIFHWSVALIIIGMLILGFVMPISLYGVHKSIGVLALVLISARVIWRLRQGWLTPIGDVSVWQRRLATAMHVSLLLATLAMPISGMVMSGAGGYGIHVFGVELVAKQPDPDNPGKVIPPNASLAGIGHEVHEWLPFIFIALIVLHVLAALKHHLIDKDKTLLRMLGRS